MSRWLLILVVLVGFNGKLTADEDAASGQDGDTTEASKVSEEGEEKSNTPVLTPITVFPQKDPYKQAMEELAAAEASWKKGDAEEASDQALEAYDDFMNVFVPKKQRAHRRAQRKRAATIYIEAGIVYIKDFVKKNGNTIAAKEEGRSRLGDLREVAVNYNELNRKLNDAMDAFAVPGSSPTVVASTATATTSSSSTVNSSTPVAPSTTTRKR